MSHCFLSQAASVEGRLPWECLQRGCQLSRLQHVPRHRHGILPGGRRGREEGSSPRLPEPDSSPAVASACPSWLASPPVCRSSGSSAICH